jgi:hypothetical protein
MKNKTYKTVNGLWRAFQKLSCPTVASDDFANRTIGFQEWPEDFPTFGRMHQIKLSKLPRRPNEGKCEACGQEMPLSMDPRPVPKGAPANFWELLSTAPGRQKLFKTTETP